jgi:hypothetical protein
MPPVDYLIEQGDIVTKELDLRHLVDKSRRELKVTTNHPFSLPLSRLAERDICLRSSEGEGEHERTLNEI